MNESTKETMQQALDALDDWLNIYAEELCDHKRVALARKRIEDNGGTLAYIAGITQNLREAIKDCEQAEAKEPVGEVVEHETSSGDSVCFGEIDTQLVHIGDKLYTHPSSVRRLGEDEIVKLGRNMARNMNFTKTRIDFDYAYAIMDACGIKEGE